MKMRKIGIAVKTMMDRVDTAVILVSKILLALMVFVTFVSVIGRDFFGRSIPDDLLISEMLMVAVVFLPLGWVQAEGAHLEVNVLSNYMPIKMQNCLVIFGMVLGVVIFGLMAYMSWESAYRAYVFNEISYNSVLGIPKWPAKMLIPFGLGWWCLRLLVQLIWPSARPEHFNEFQSAIEDADLGSSEWSGK